MPKCWMGAALLVFAMVAREASAQYPSWPGQAQTAPAAEPMPYSSSVAGFSSFSQSPPGGYHPMTSEPSTPNSLPADLPNAWCDDQGSEPPACYLSIGYMALMRQKLGNSVAAVLDTASGGVDTGNTAPPGSPVAANFNDINPRFNNGFRALVGYHWGNSSLEVSGFYMSQNSSSKVYTDPGRLDALFNTNGSFINAPLGFEGDNGLWLQADLIRLQLQTALGSAEVDYRFWPDNTNFNVLLGVRYLDLYERFGFFTGDDDLTFVGANGQPDPTRQALYSVTAHNHLVAPQLGLEWTQPIGCYLAFTMMCKGAWGANFLDVNTLLKRGDGLVGFTGGRSQTIFSHVYEAGFFLDVCLGERARLRAGYDLLWAVDVAEAIDQLDFNLANTNGRTDNHGSVFYHGPVAELHFLF